MSQYSQDYAMQELLAAVQSLKGKGDLRDKLHSASVHHLLHITSEHLPEIYREPLAAIQRALFYSTPAEGDEGTAKASIDAMTDQQVSEMIESILLFGPRISILDEAATLVEMARKHMRLALAIESAAQGPMEIANTAIETYRKALREYRDIEISQHGRVSA